ncbi:MAG TPA: hypothetical protein VGL70_23320 [Candidatus Binatia bacterium]|jgi:hypothetical protein
MSPWQLIFRQSRVNNGIYDGDRLPAQNWDWPQGTWLQERLRYLRHLPANSSKNGPGQNPARLSIVPLLLADEEISTEARRALLENRLTDAAQALIREHGLSCIEAGDLLDVSAC